MKDKISALMDDELELDGYEYLLTAAKAEGELHECWSTYHMIGDVIRGTALMQHDFKHKLMQKLEEEPTVLAPVKVQTASRKPVFMSIAASMAAVMFVGWMVLQQMHQNPESVTVEIAQNIPSEYLLAHQSSVPNNAAYFVQPASYSEGSR